MTDKTLKILLGIIAVNLTLQTIKQIGLFPTLVPLAGFKKLRCAMNKGGYALKWKGTSAEIG